MEPEENTMVWEEMEGRTEGGERDRYSKTKQKRERESKRESKKNEKIHPTCLQHNNGANAIYYLSICLHITAE